ncbi:MULTISPECIES: glycosyltransferase [unclassified Parafrankia]|uniref:glycosyltransferase n=1 Tax=unclassified Parafrankia TaxID=2994368 RepID=UPI000DA58B49|nr:MULTISPECIES: hypothetical protein [unclassified Parafrankia]SQD96854.1 hypothetical protein FMEAI12_3780018 [Parafrankia sp. Ea1.12]
MRPQDRPRPVPTRPVSATSWPAARRGRVTGTDLLTRFATGAAPVDAFGIGVDAPPAHTGLAPDRLATYDDVSQAAMHEQFARRRVYVHLPRRASLGLSLLEATHLGMPVVALAVTEAYEAVPPGDGALSTNPGTPGTRHAPSSRTRSSPTPTERRPARPRSTGTASTASCGTGMPCSATPPRTAETALRRQRVPAPAPHADCLVPDVCLDARDTRLSTMPPRHLARRGIRS